MIVVNSILYFFAFTISGFIVWKRLKDDYLNYQIFNSYLLVVILIIIGNFIVKNYISNIIFWMDVTAVLIGVFYAFVKYRMRFIETSEAFLVSFLLYLNVYYFDYMFIMKDYRIILISLVTLLSFATFFIFEKLYKSFTWYKSGKIGFSGYAAFFIFMVTRALFSYFFKDLPFYGFYYDSLFSAITALIIMIVVYTIGNRKV
jgi:hypothetical protein